MWGDLFAATLEGKLNAMQAGKKKMQASLVRLPSLGKLPSLHASTPTAKAEAGEASSVTADTDEPGRVREVGYAGRGRARTLDRGSGTASRCSTVLTVLWVVR